MPIACPRHGRSAGAAIYIPLAPGKLEGLCAMCRQPIG